MGLQHPQEFGCSTRISARAKHLISMPLHIYRPRRSHRSWDGANRSTTCGVTASHYDDVIMGATASQIASLTIVYSTVYSDADQRKHQSSTSLAFVRGIHRGTVNSPHKWPVTRKMFPFDDVIMHNKLGARWSSKRLTGQWLCRCTAF